MVLLPSFFEDKATGLPLANALRSTAGKIYGCLKRCWVQWAGFRVSTITLRTLLELGQVCPGKLGVEFLSSDSIPQQAMQ